MVSATEVFALVEAIERLPASTRDVVKNRVHAVASRVKEMPSQVYMKTNVECAMLLEGKCSMYAARPVPCRGHHSADVSICKETFDDVHSSAFAPNLGIQLSKCQRNTLFKANLRCRQARGLILHSTFNI